MPISTEQLNDVITNASPLDVKEMVEIISLYRFICGNTAAIVDRQTAAELYEQSGDLFRRLNLL